jgi:hypothetical protein
MTLLPRRFPLRLLCDYVYPNVYGMIENVSRSAIGAAYR